jgi:hypothetical protein
MMRELEIAVEDATDGNNRLCWMQLLKQRVVESAKL